MRGLISLIILFQLAFAADYFLPDLLQKAENNNPKIKAAKAVISEAEERVKLEQINWIPDINIGGGINGQDTNNNYSSFSIGVGKLFGQGSRVAIAKNQLEQAKQNYENTKSDIFAKVADAYERWIMHKKKQEVMERTYKSSIETLAIVKKFFAEGNTPPYEVVKSEDIVARLELEVENEKGFIKQIEHEINLLCGDKI